MAKNRSKRGFFELFSKMALTIFLKLDMLVNIDVNKKVTKPDYPEKFWIIQKVRKCGHNDSFLKMLRND